MRGVDERSRIATRNFSALLHELRHEMIGGGTAVGAAQAFGRLCGGLRKATAAHHAEDCWHFGLSGACVCRDFRVWPCVDCRYHFPAWLCSGYGSGASRHLAR